MTPSFVAHRTCQHDRLTWWLALLAGAAALIGIAASQYA